MDMSKRCALMRQTWYEAAKANMKSEPRLALYEAIFNYSFYDEVPNREKCPFSEVLLMFDTVKFAIEQDKAKADAVAERNRRNGLKGGRPRANTEPNPVGFGENPKKPSGLTGFPYTYTNTNTSTHTNVSVHTDFELYQKFLILLHFFAIGVKDAAKEVQLFYDYYTARGWTVAKDTPVLDRLALARAWRPREIVPDLIQARAPYVEFLRAIDCEEQVLVNDFVLWRQEMTEDKPVIHLHYYGRQAHDLLEDKYLSQMSDYFTSSLNGAELKYHINPKLIE